MAIKFNARTNKIELDAGTMTFEASTTGDASINIPHGTAPTTPDDGDVWTTTAGMYVRVNGGTVGPLGAGGGGGIGGSIADNQIAVGAATADDIEGSANLTWDGSEVLIRPDTTSDKWGLRLESSNDTDNDSGFYSRSSNWGLILRNSAGTIVYDLRTDGTASTLSGGIGITGDSSTNGLFQVGGSANVNGGAYLIVKDLDTSGSSALSFMEFVDSADTRYGAVGKAASANSDMYISANVGDIRISAVGGDIFLEDNVSVTGSITASSLTNNRVLIAGTSGLIEDDANLTYDGSTLTAPALALTTALDETDGGTGQTTYTTGDILYASAANTLSKLAAGTNTHVLTLSGGVPTWAAPPSGIGGSILDDQVAVGASTSNNIEGTGLLTFSGILTQFQVGNYGNVADAKLLLAGASGRSPELRLREFSDSFGATVRYNGSSDRMELNVIDSGTTRGAIYIARATGEVQIRYSDATKLTTTTSGVSVTGNVSATGTVSGSNLSGTNTGDEPAASDTVAGIVELATIAETNTGTDATRAVTPDGLDGWTGSAQVTTLGTIGTGVWQGTAVDELYGGTGFTTYATGDIIYASGANTLSKLTAGTNGHVLTLSAGVPVWSAAGSGNVSNTGTPVNNQLAIWTDATTIEGDAKVTFDGSSFAAYGDGTAPDNHYLGLNSTNRFRFESGANYGLIQYEDDNVSTEDSYFYIGNQSLSTGTHNILFRKGGSDWYHAEWYGSAARFRHTGPIEILGGSDHVGTGGSGTGIDANYFQLWGKQRSLDHEPMITTGDSDLDYTILNINTLSYHHDQTTTAADPGAGNIRWNSTTPASVTNLYIDDVESTGRDASFMLSNLAVGDIITIRSQWDAADYLVCSVSTAPTDNTGYWTVPVTIIHSGTGAPATGDPVHISVEWAGSQASGGGPTVYTAYKTGTTSRTSTTTLADDPDLSVTVVETGYYMLEVCFIWGNVTTTTQGFRYVMSGGLGHGSAYYRTAAIPSATAEFGTLSSTTSVHTNIPFAGTNTPMVGMGFRDITTANTVFKLRWAQGTSSANATELRAGSFIRLTRLGDT